MKIYKIASTDSVSFDFDNTIVLYEWNDGEKDYQRDEAGNCIGKINDNIINLMQKYKSEGKKVYIVSSRREEYKYEIENIVREYGINVDGIFCTAGMDKVDKLKELGVFRHYDDDMYEIKLCNAAGIDGIQV